MCTNVPLMRSVLRKLVRMLSKMIPVDVFEKGDLAPGGDLRKEGNRWVVEAVRKVNPKRCLREGRVLHVITYLAAIHPVC